MILFYACNFPPIYSTCNLSQYLSQILFKTMRIVVMMKFQCVLLLDLVRALEKKYVLCFNIVNMIPFMVFDNYGLTNSLSS